MNPVLVVGPGAVGCVLAAHWAKTHPVLLLGRAAAAEAALAKDGFDFIEPAGNRRRVKKGLHGARASRRECAAAFFCVKGGDTAAAVKAARPWIGPETAVVGLQNGLRHASLLRRAFGARAVIGTCFIAADRPQSGVVAHTGGSEVWLAQNNKNRFFARTAKSLLNEGGWKVAVKTAEDRMLWTKLVFNAAVNPLGAACNATNGQLAEDPSLRRLLLDLLAEAQAAAKRHGHNVYFADMSSTLLRACAALPNQRNSMLQDLAAGRKTERRAILGPLLNSKTPLLSVFDRLIRRLEAR